MKFFVKTPIVLAAIAAALTGCSTSEDPRLEGVALSGGNAIAENSALQIIDPWPEGVSDTDLVVPAHRDSGDEAPAAASPVVPLVPSTDIDVGDLS